MAASFGRLAVISTPIGNLGDLSPRARDELAAAELVAAEDTRRTGQLLTTLGLSRPLAVPVKTGAAWAEAHVREQMGQDSLPVEAARREWETDPHNQFGIEGEDADPYHQRVFGVRAPVDALTLYCETVLDA